MSEEITQTAPAESGVETQGTEAPAAEATVVDGNGETVSETTYLDGKYKSVSELEKGYRELQSSYSKKLGSFDGAPEQYTINEGLEVPDFLQDWGKNNQLNNDGINSLVENFNSYQEQQNEAIVAEQMKALGDNAKDRITNVNDFLRANLGDNHGIDTMSAAGVESIEKLIAMTKQAAPAVASSKPAIDSDTLAQMRFAKDENGNRRMATDPEYRARVEALANDFYQNS